MNQFVKNALQREKNIFTLKRKKSILVSRGTNELVGDDIKTFSAEEKERNLENLAYQKRNQHMKEIEKFYSK